MLNFISQELTIPVSYQKVIIQVEVNLDSFKYRILYSSPNDRKIQVIASINGNLVTLNEATYLNDGYESIPAFMMTTFINKADTVALNTFEFLQNARLVDVQKNVTKIKLIYSTNAKTYRVLLSVNFDNA